MQDYKRICWILLIKINIHRLRISCYGKSYDVSRSIVEVNNRNSEFAGEDFIFFYRKIKGAGKGRIFNERIFTQQILTEIGSIQYLLFFHFHSQ